MFELESLQIIESAFAPLLCRCDVGPEGSLQVKIYDSVSGKRELLLSKIFPARQSGNQAIAYVITETREELNKRKAKAKSRARAMEAWQKLFAGADRNDAEARYAALLSLADDMECTGLINADEWRQLVRRAGTAFSMTAECMVGQGEVLAARLADQQATIQE